MGQNEARRDVRLFNAAIFSHPNDALLFLETILESSTEYSIIGKDMHGIVVLWNEGARLNYGWQPEEIIGRSSDILHVADDVQAGLPAKIRETASAAGKWEGIVSRLRKDGQTFPARVVMTPLRDGGGSQLGFLVVSKSLAEEVRLAEELRLAQTVTELSTPVLSIKPGLLLAPVIGVLGATRMQQLAQQLLDEVRRTSAQVVVVDITGVPSIDEATAGYLIQANNSCSLLGAQVVVTGISGDNAAAMVNLGVNLANLDTAGDLQAGIAHAERLLRASRRFAAAQP